MAQRRTDNANTPLKLSLRRELLRPLAARKPDFSVLDCCAGSGLLWHELKREFPAARVTPLDFKAAPGRLKIKSERFLEVNADFDVIDVDTWGSPWAHFKAILEAPKRERVVFLTYGYRTPRRGITQISAEETEWFGCSRDMARMIFRSDPHWYCATLLAQALSAGYMAPEGFISAESLRALYFGLRLVPAA